jgi:hypothetical protein
MDSKNPRYTYNKHGMKGARVGQAVTDMLSKEAQPMTCEELLDGFSIKFAQELEKSVNDSLGKFRSPFYILALTKKEFWSEIIVRNWFVPRQTAPHTRDLALSYPNYTKTLYVVDGDKGDIKVAWSMPSEQDCISILRNPSIYSQELVQWINDCYAGKLDLDNYSHLFRR